MKRSMFVLLVFLGCGGSEGGEVPPPEDAGGSGAIRGGNPATGADAGAVQVAADAAQIPADAARPSSPPDASSDPIAAPPPQCPLSFYVNDAGALDAVARRCGLLGSRTPTYWYIAPGGPYACYALVVPPPGFEIPCILGVSRALVKSCDDCVSQLDAGR